MYLCNNQALLKAVKRWVGEGGKATLVGAPDADILLDAIEELRKRTTVGAATFLVKVKAHRTESANEEADIQLSRQGYFKQRCSHGMARQDKSSSLPMARTSPERKYGEI